MNISILVILIVLFLGFLSPTSTSESESVAVSIENSMETPIPLGDTARVGDYEVRIIEVTSDAKSILEESNGVAVSADNPYQFFMVRVELTYVGDDVGDTMRDINFHAAGEANSYSRFGDHGCGRVPDQQLEVGDLAPAESAEINVCWAIDPTDAESLVVLAESGNDAIWFAVRSEDVP